MKLWGSSCAVVFAVALVGCGAAAAQVADTVPPDLLGTIDETVDEAVPPPRVVQPLTLPPPPITERQNRVSRDDDGLIAGSFRFLPQIEIGGLYSTNATQDVDQARDDFALKIAPQIRLQSDWSRHALSVDGEIEFVTFAETKSADVLSGSINATGRLDIRSTTRLTLQAGYQLEDARSDLPDNATELRTEQDANASATLDQDFGAISGQVALRAQRFDVGNVALAGNIFEDNKDRAYMSPGLSVRVAYNSGAAIRPFIEAGFDTRIHDLRLDRNGIRRDSNGFRFGTGIDIAANEIWEGSLAATYLVRDFADASLATVDAAGLAGQLTWQPTTQTRLQLESGVAIDETRDPGVSAQRNWSAAFGVAQLLRDNVELSGRVTAIISDGVDKSEFTYGATLGASWQINPYLALAGSLESTWFVGSANNDNYDEQRIIASIIVKR